ncbi:peptidylprolyl isomerase [Schlegelella sp. S2-27]|uniref:Periplasmic chaperone PpiD n=1 Tax=Caldimonas mangrovi TaxID=2944811 RepID=A0ABT0YQ90_9BURK|nr:SurA N-terminal domain-containing protein [Caldimonas mangrovi]MCM5680417.1 peptidylprolyl isomerase [Caldimonas mangrovi]
MFDFVRNNTRVLFFVLMLLIIPSFVFFGVQGYTQFREGADEVAKVAGQPISGAELEAAHRNQIERVRQQMPGVDVKMLDTPEMRRETLEALVRERVMAAAANDLHLVTDDERLHRIFLSDPQLAFLRNPDGSVNRDALAMRGMTPAMFTESLRRDLSLRQVMQGVTQSTVAGKAATDAALDAFLQQREVQVARFDAKEYTGRVDPTEEQLKAYYDNPAHAAQFQQPEQATIEYAVLDLDSVMKTISVPEDKLREYYKQNEGRYSKPEERRASHILVKSEKSDTADKRAAAKAKAEQLLAEVKKNPQGFAELAKKNSDDPGSAASGGDLGFFGRGAMVQPFADAAFSMKPGETSDVVETDFGYHIIRLHEVRGGDKQPFESVQAQIEQEVRRQLAQQAYAEAAEQFSNTVYEQDDSLKPAADKLKLEVQTARNVTRNPGPGVQGPIANAKLLEAVFADETLRSKRNTKAIEIGPNQLAAARVIEYSPARTLPFDEVKNQVRDRVVAQQAAQAARKEGEAKLAEWKQSPDAAQLRAAVTVSRVQPNEQPRQVVEAALKADPAQLPAWVGVDLGAQGYAVVKVNKIAGRAELPGGQQLDAQYRQAWSSAESQAYYEVLKNRYKVEISDKLKVSAAQ